jgi:hypothetical protein
MYSIEVLLIIFFLLKNVTIAEEMKKKNEEDKYQNCINNKFLLTFYLPQYFPD